mgnify:CR=1 FL=1
MPGASLSVHRFCISYCSPISQTWWKDCPCQCAETAKKIKSEQEQKDAAAAKIQAEADKIDDEVYVPTKAWKREEQARKRAEAARRAAARARDEKLGYKLVALQPKVQKIEVKGCQSCKKMRHVNYSE